jgi:hypothetical protein
VFFRIKIIGFQKVVVDVLNGDIHLCRASIHGLQFEHHESTKHILQQHLVGDQTNLLARDHRSAGQVSRNQELGKVGRHGSTPLARSLKDCVWRGR